jgi:hypothetical protein
MQAVCEAPLQSRIYTTVALKAASSMDNVPLDCVCVDVRRDESGNEDEEED